MPSCDRRHRRRAGTSLLIWSLCCLFAPSHAESVCRNRRSCAFGGLPGLWREDESPQWQTLDPCCQLQDLVGITQQAPAAYNSTHDEDTAVRVLIFGDSVERITLHDLCDQDQWDNWGHDQTLFHSCRRGGILISRQSMIGVHPSGPYHMDMVGSPIQRVQNVSLRALAI